MSSSNPPRVFGALFALLGLALAAGGLHLNMNLGGGGSYFLVVGLLFSLTGTMLFAGKSIALLVYGFALAVIWFWSFKETGGQLQAMIPRIGLPTIFAFYIFSTKIRSQLT